MNPLLKAGLILVLPGCAHTSTGGSAPGTLTPTEELVTKSLRVVDEQGQTRIHLQTKPYGAYAVFQDAEGAPLIQVGTNDEEGPLAVVFLHDQQQGMVQLSLDRTGSIAVELLQNGGRVTLEVNEEGRTTIQGEDVPKTFNEPPSQTGSNSGRNASRWSRSSWK